MRNTRIVSRFAVLALAVWFVCMGRPTAGETLEQTGAQPSAAVSYNVLHSFAGGTADGANPYGSLVLSGTNLYGMTFWGGANNLGTIFEFNVKTGQLTLLHSFEGAPADGATPYGSLILSGTTLYGMTPDGGANNRGTIFKFNIKTSHLTLLHSFENTPTAAIYPMGSLVFSGTNLYGMTPLGGTRQDGTVFEFNVKTSQMTLLHSFFGDGYGPYGNPILSWTDLYGTTYGGGEAGLGLIFKLNTLNGELTLLHSFQRGTADGATPLGSLVFWGTNLYGMTAESGANGFGTIFEFNIQTGQLTLLHSFEGAPADGATPCGSLVLSGTNFYGMTSEGGAYGAGVIFSLR
jgi:uncharacterized repeat protein (TIGR03803 family)